MFQTFRLLYIIIFIFLNIVRCLDTYVIYTTNVFEQSAQQIATLHGETIPAELGLPALQDTIIYKEDVDIDTFIEILEEDFDEFDKKYLLIIGDETVIPPLTAVYGNSNIECTNQYDTKYTDDLFNREFAVGRIIVDNNQDALQQINKIKNYILNSVFGIWKNKILLIADDQHNPDIPDIEKEFDHTTNTNSIYTTHLRDKTVVNTLYGTDYLNQQSMFTNTIINSINSGISLINYIGHGSRTHLAHEDILVLDRDIDLITTNNRPPIWVVGTCSFGEYKNNEDEISFVEKLLKKPDAAIAIIATTAGIKPSASFTYLDEFYEQLSSYISYSEEGEEIHEGESILRLGDLLKDAKSVSGFHDCNRLAYQLFGDPALPIIIPKQVNDIFESPNQITAESQNFLDINYEGESYIKIMAKDITYNTNINGIPIEYSSPGGTLFESYFSNEINYYIPIDIEQDSAKIIVYNTQGNSRFNNYRDIVQFSTPIVLQTNTGNIDEQLLEDTEGPNIKFYNNNIEVFDNTSIFSPYNIRIDITDDLPINMSGSHNHNLLFWINDDKNNALILNDMFNPTSDISGSVILNFEDSKFEETVYYLNVESWDILSNNTVKTIRVNVNQNLNEIFNVYNFPNPFHDKTFFTFHMKNPEPIDIKITIYSKTGKQITTLQESINEIKSYHVFPESGWDGTDRYSSQLKNGTYFYHLNIKTINGNVLHDKVHKITILK